MTITTKPITTHYLRPTRRAYTKWPARQGTLSPSGDPGWSAVPHPIEILAGQVGRMEGRRANLAFVGRVRTSVVERYQSPVRLQAVTDELARIESELLPPARTVAEEARSRRAALEPLPLLPRPVVPGWLHWIVVAAAAVAELPLLLFAYLLVPTGWQWQQAGAVGLAAANLLMAVVAGKTAGRAVHLLSRRRRPVEGLAEALHSTAVAVVALLPSAVGLVGLLCLSIRAQGELRSIAASLAVASAGGLASVVAKLGPALATVQTVLVAGAAVVSFVGYDGWAAERSWLEENRRAQLAALDQQEEAERKLHDQAAVLRQRSEEIRVQAAGLEAAVALERSTIGEQQSLLAVQADAARWEAVNAILRRMRRPAEASRLKRPEVTEAVRQPELPEWPPLESLTPSGAQAGEPSVIRRLVVGGER